MFGEILDVFDRDGRRGRAAGEQRGLRGFLGRLLGGGEDDDDDRSRRNRDDDDDDRGGGSPRRRERDNDGFDFGD